MLIYNAVQDQYIMSMGGAVAINQMAIHQAMRLYGIDNRVDCFEKVVTAYREVIKQNNERAEAERESKGK